jgi:nitroreductase
MEKGQWILAAVCAVTGITALIMGISDNITAIALLVISIACFVAIWVWIWHSARKFWILLGAALLSFPIGVILHNLFYAMEELSSDIQILSGILGFISVIFFLVSALGVGPTAVVALIGGIFTSWQGMTGLVVVNRSYRRFKQSHQISFKDLLRLVNLARLSASGANLQPLKYILSFTEEQNGLIFPTLSWAGYLKDWAGPVEGEKPSAYIIVLGDTEIGNGFQYDTGIACQSILLGAAERGLGGCIIGSIKRDKLREDLTIPEHYEILLVIALGKPTEKVVVTELEPDGDIKYWRDEKDIHHVPKRRLVDLILDL